MVELPLGLVILGSTYIGITIAIGALVSLLTSPSLILHRRKSAYFDDWNSGLKAPWLFWYIGGLWYRLTGELLHDSARNPASACTLWLFGGRFIGYFHR